MSDSGKRIFLAICIVVPFLVYCVYYYGIMIKNAPYKFSELESITLNYGLGDSLVNRYTSKTGEYQYINDQDSLIKTSVKLSKDDLLYLHRKAAELGFWNFPENLRSQPVQAGFKLVPHYYLEFRYQRKTKKIDFDLNYVGDPKLLDAAKTLVETVNTTIHDAQERKQQ